VHRQFSQFATRALAPVLFVLGPQVASAQQTADRPTQAAGSQIQQGFIDIHWCDPAAGHHQSEVNVLTRSTTKLDIFESTSTYRFRELPPCVIVFARHALYYS
jgi:hypothetical protein